MRSAFAFTLSIMLISPAAVQAQDVNEDFELWLNPAVEFGIDEDTAVELETAQRFRSSENGRADTYFARGWIKQDLNANLTLAGAVERRVNDGGSNELRTMQQLSASYGIFRGRLRLEERFVEGNDGRMGLRLRPRAGVAFPLSADGRWSAGADAELSWTLRGTSPLSDTGITGLRTQIGVGYNVTDTLEIELTYLRQQDFEEGGPDDVGHAPLIGIGWSF